TSIVGCSRPSWLGARHSRRSKLRLEWRAPSKRRRMTIVPPLKGVRVVELTHTILGPSCGMILADLGAEVIKVEPLDGDRTRKLKGFGGGFFGYFNRNKRSLALDADAKTCRAVLVKLLEKADVLIE